MTVPSGEKREDYNGNGTTDTYSYGWRIFAKTELQVVTRDSDGAETMLTVDDDYTVSGVLNPNGGSITLTAGNLASGTRLTIVPDFPVEQETDFRNQGSFFAQTHEDQFDKLVMLIAQLNNSLDRVVRLPISTNSTDFDGNIPSSMIGQANKALITDEDGSGFKAGPTANEIAQAQAYAEEAKGYLEDFGGVQFADLFNDFVVTGLLPATSVNLQSDISAGGAYVAGVRVTKDDATPHTYTASKDTYVDLGSDGSFSYTEVSTGAGAPAVPADHIRLAKVVTDADNITSVDDLRTLVADIKSVNAQATVDNVADMKQRAGDFNGQQIRTLGLGDQYRDEMTFWWDADSADADNDRTVFQVTGVSTGRWVLSSDYNYDYWLAAAALLDPSAYEFQSGTGWSLTVSDGPWYLTNAWHIGVNSSTEELFLRRSNASVDDVLALKDGTTIEPTKDGGGGFAYVCKPSTVESEDNYADPKKLYYSRKSQLAELTVHTIYKEAASGLSAVSTAYENFPTDFDDAIIVWTSLHDVSWAGLDAAGSQPNGLHSWDEISDSSQIRFAGANLIPFKRTVFDKIGVQPVRYAEYGGGVVTGTFTPTLQGDSGAGTTDSNTYSRQTGTFGQVGNVFTCVIDIDIGTVSMGAGTNDLQIAGLPADIAQYATGKITLSGVSYPTNARDVVLTTPLGGRVANLEWVNNDGSMSAVTVSDINGSSMFVQAQIAFASDDVDGAVTGKAALGYVKLPSGW